MGYYSNSPADLVLAGVGFRREVHCLQILLRRKEKLSFKRVEGSNRTYDVCAQVVVVAISFQIELW